MKTELYRAIKGIDPQMLAEKDKEDLLGLFMSTTNDLIRDQIALLFADLKHEKAVPFILEKINEEGLFNKNGSLVHALGDFEMKDHFFDLIKIICTQGYEARLMAFGIVEKLASSISNADKTKALTHLEEVRLTLEEQATEKGENSALHFVEKTIALF